MPAALIAIALLLAVLVGSVAPPAAAHDQLLSSSPADGAAIGSLPSEIELVLTATPLAAGATLVLTTPDGRTLTAGTPEVDTARGAATFPVTGDGPPGTYTAAWHVVSSDGHPIEGTLKFTVKSGPTPAKPPPSPIETRDNQSPSATASGASQKPTVTPPARESTAVSTNGTNDRRGSNPLAVIAALVAGVVAVLVLVTFITRRRGSLREPGSPSPGESAKSRDDTDRPE
ncbi:copper resistance CopC family protein [Myceligenerans crystallogenes]|uniref:copper resistance CopC family protein n=1 Tax=Myceligenerans crystallogenes TaxID=316335 RepID=UPI0031E3F023